MTRMMATLSRFPKPWTTFLALVLAALVGALDYVTGYDFNVTALYLIPVCWACWAAGRAAGVFLATACAVIFAVAELMSGHVHEHPWFPYWNALVLLSVFVGAVYALGAVLEARNSMREGESRFQALFSQSLVGVAQVDTTTGRWVRVNQRLCDMLGYPTATGWSTPTWNGYPAQPYAYTPPPLQPLLTLIRGLGAVTPS